MRNFAREKDDRFCFRTSPILFRICFSFPICFSRFQRKLSPELSRCQVPPRLHHPEITKINEDYSQKLVRFKYENLCVAPSYNGPALRNISVFQTFIYKVQRRWLPKA